MKLVSWNVNGIRACLKKGFAESVANMDCDVICIQEVKCQEDTLPDLDLGYSCSYFNYAEKRGYSGTAIFSRTRPKCVSYDIPGHDSEGRLIRLDFGSFNLVNVYVPNSGDGLRRLGYRTTEWEPAIRDYLADLMENKPLVLCGDLNVAHHEIDLRNPASNRRSAGFTDEEREQLDFLLDTGFIDSFRHFYPEKEGAYSWWSYRTRARERNAGWRIDYFLVSKTLETALKNAEIHENVHGSDHCPVGILLDITCE